MKKHTVTKLLLALSVTLCMMVMLTSTQAQEFCPGCTDYEDVQGSPRSPIDDQRVLLMGDSQTAGAFGGALMPHITAKGAVYYARAGEVGWGVVNWWRQRHNVDRLMRRHHPTLVLVELGGNDWQRSARVDYGTHVSNLWNYVRERAEENKPEGTTVSYCWISPARVVGPAEHIQPGRDRAAEVIRSVVGSEHYVESNDITGAFGRTPDGLHFTHGGGNDWARRIIPRIEQCIRNQLNR